MRPDVGGLAILGGMAVVPQAGDGVPAGLASAGSRARQMPYEITKHQLIHAMGQKVHGGLAGGP